MKTENKRKVGNPRDKKFTTIAIAVTYEEAEAVNKALAEFNKKNNTSIKKTQFIRSLLPKSLFK